MSNDDFQEYALFTDEELRDFFGIETTNINEEDEFLRDLRLSEFFSWYDPKLEKRMRAEQIGLHIFAVDGVRV